MSTAASEIQLSSELVELIKKTANTQGRTPEELLQDALNLFISEDRWKRVLAYGKQQAELLGYTEEDVERLIHESRCVQDLVP